MESQAHDRVSLTGPFVGLVVTAVLFGFTILQALQYYMRFPKDPLATKCKVAFVCILDFLQFTFTISFVHSFFISNCEEGSSIENVWSLKALTTLQTILTVSVHFIYLQRIHTLSNIPTINKPIFSKIINVVILLIGFCAIGGGAAFVYGVLRTEGVVASEITQGSRWALIIGLGDNVFIDVVITALTCFVLHKNRIEIGLDYISKWSNRLLLSLFTYSLATGLLTSVAATLLLIIYLARPDSLDYMSLALIMAKLYTNSLLSLVQSVRRQINKDLISTNESRLPSVMVFGEASQRSRLTTVNANVSANHKTPPSLIGFDLDLNAEPQYTEKIRRPEVSYVFSPYGNSFQPRKGVGQNLRMGDPEIIDEESWISIQRVPKRAWLNWPIDRRSSL